MKYKKFRVCWIVAALGCLCCAKLFAQEPAQDAAAAKRRTQEQAIRANVEQFVKAYDAHDAKAIASLFLPQAQILDERDNVIQGRENIEAFFAELFAENPKTGIKVDIESIEFVGPTFAVETGSSTTEPPAGEKPEAGRYSCIHIFQDGKWSMGLVRDVPAKPTHRDHLEALAWMVGSWIDESREGMVKTHCHWSEDGSFLIQEITAKPTGRDPMKISQRIGWDPLGKRLKSWVFDSEGGYGESTWTPTETGWLIRFNGVNSDGTIASATNHIQPTDLNRYVYQSTDRARGDEILPPVQVIVVRQPPEPTGHHADAAKK